MGYMDFLGVDITRVYVCSCWLRVGERADGGAFPSPIPPCLLSVRSCSVFFIPTAHGSPVESYEPLCEWRFCERAALYPVRLRLGTGACVWSALRRSVALERDLDMLCPSRSAWVLPGTHESAWKWEHVSPCSVAVRASAARLFTLLSRLVVTAALSSFPAQSPRQEHLRRNGVSSPKRDTRKTKTINHNAVDPTHETTPRFRPASVRLSFFIRANGDQPFRFRRQDCQP